MKRSPRLKLQQGKLIYNFFFLVYIAGKTISHMGHYDTHYVWLCQILSKTGYNVVSEAQVV